MARVAKAFTAVNTENRYARLGRGCCKMRTLLGGEHGGRRRRDRKLGPLDPLRRQTGLGVWVGGGGNAFN